MKPRQILFWILKAGAAGVTAFLILNALSYFYYYIPYNVECESGATDFVLPANFKGFNGEEGYVPIQLDKNGYNNEMVPDEINVLCIGSSHTLAYTVKPGEGYPAILNKSLQDSNGMTAYNIGMFGHEWYYCMDNLEEAIETFQPTDYVVVESFYSKFETAKLQRLNDNKYADAGQVTSKLVRTIKQFPYLQLASHQLKNMMSQSTKISAGTTQTETILKSETSLPEDYITELEQTFARTAEIVSKQNCKFIFLYHPDVLVDEKGNAYTDTDKVYLAYTKELCEKYGFIFVDMSATFLQAYEDSYILPRGFANTKIGYGHLNRYGHEMIAEELYQIITEERSQTNELH